MEKIKSLMQNKQFDEALKIINEEISDSKNIDTDKYHELFFAKGLIYIDQFENIKPVNNDYYYQAKESFVHSDSAYKALHGKQSEKYSEAIIYADRLFSNLNMKTDTSSEMKIPPTK